LVRDLSSVAVAHSRCVHTLRHSQIPDLAIFVGENSWFQELELWISSASTEYRGLGDGLRSRVCDLARSRADLEASSKEASAALAKKSFAHGLRVVQRNAGRKDGSAVHALPLRCRGHVFGRRDHDHEQLASRSYRRTVKSIAN
jgi:hypothetical protein